MRVCLLPPLLAAVVLLASPSGGPAAGYEQVETRDGFQARLRVDVWPAPSEPSDSVEVRLSGELIVTLSVEGPPPLEVAPVPAVTESKGWQVAEASAPKVVTQGGRRTWSQEFRIDPRQPGEVPLQVAPIRVRRGPEPAPWEEVTWKPIPVRVVTEVPRADLGELRDVTGPEEPPGEPAWEFPTRPALVAAVVVSLLVVGWLVGRRRKRGVSQLPADQWALRELEKLEARGLPPAGEADRYHTQLDDVVRRYLELRFQLPAPRQTTAEFLESMRRSPHLTAEQRALLRDFLERCDLAKFAHSEPSADECRAAARMARDLIEQTAGAIVE